MLIRFKVENFTSFGERQEFSLIPGRTTLKSEHKTLPVNGISTLKTSLIYGANASGKSNLTKAIAFGQRLVLKGTKADSPIDFQNFRLDKSFSRADSRIEYEIQHRGKNYAYGFVFNREKIVEEWLYEVKKTSEVKLFERDNRKEEPFDLEYFFKLNSKVEEKQFLTFIAKSTPDNQLFLTEIRERKTKGNVSNIDDLMNVIDWFYNSLNVLSPEGKYKQGLKFEIQNNQDVLKVFQELLDYFDTGIHGISFEDVDRSKVDLPDEVLSAIENEIFNVESQAKGGIMSSKNNTYIISKSENGFIYQKFMTKHRIKGSNEFELFDSKDLSDGTNRIIDFIPLLMDLMKGDNVFVVDEMERSLHPNIIYDLIDFFTSRAGKINSQLIVASHESTLLTQKLLRKDEIWFVTKDDSGASRLHSLEEYDVRFDKEIRKDYLLGRFRGVPHLGNRNKITVIPN
ncbi:AAA family ATPase [Chitinophaga deserti]|uniref:AAA family ATPase n=1 Tax=Chitinophaga deserti TaxID=2164099 RepID=UPI000D6D74AD|nr:ATP-binding protein [Chitinophaga deserti]